MSNYEQFKIKHELCEIIICDVNDKLREYALPLWMDLSFSIMPFGKKGLHSLTAVSFTPHMTSYDAVSAFKCQKGVESFCSPFRLGNCNDCKNNPVTAYRYMSAPARKYLLPEYAFNYSHSLFSMKPIFMSSEIDDSRQPSFAQPALR